MGISTVQVKEYECERCGWKWVRRINGKDLEGRPSGCAQCKSDLWDYPRKNKALLSSYYWLYLHKNCKDFIKQRFLNLYNNKTDEEWYSIDKDYRQKIDRLAFDLQIELSAKNK